MEFTKAFYQRTTYGLLFTTVLFGAIALMGPGNLATFSSTGSSRISWSDAQKLQQEYLGFKPMRVKYTDASGTEQKEDLKGFVFTATHLDTIINYNASGTKPDEVYFIFGQDGTFSEGILGMTKRPNMHIIAVGMNGKNLLISGSKPSIFDKADPCPPNCPN